MERDLTAQLATYAARVSEMPLPPAVIERAREIMLDTVGAMALGAGPEYAAVQRLVDLARAFGGTGQCTLIGQGTKSDLISAVLVNGAASYAADIEGAGIGRQHAATVLVPTVLSVGEFRRATGRQVIAALALAYDVAAATGTAYPHSFHPSAVSGHFAATVAAGHLLGLDADGFERALGLAGVTAGGLITWINDPTENARPYVIGVAAQAGVRAAWLARRGYGGPLGRLDAGKHDIYDAFSGERHLEKLTVGLGEEWRILDAGGYKQCPCCGDIHTGLDALLMILDSHDLSPERSAGITQAVRPERVKVIDNNPLKSHCAQCIMAVAAAERQIAADVILIDRRETDPRVAALVERVSLVGDPTLLHGPGGAPAAVTVVTTDGAVHHERVDSPRGSRQNPLPPTELRAKFLALAGQRLGEARAQRITMLVDELEMVDDVSALVALLA